MDEIVLMEKDNKVFCHKSDYFIYLFIYLFIFTYLFSLFSSFRLFLID